MATNVILCTTLRTLVAMKKCFRQDTREKRPARLCLKFSLRKPYMIGLEQTEVMADRWQPANSISITFLSSSLLSKGSKVSMTMLRMLRGAQERKKMTLTVISILLVFLLLCICLALLCPGSLYIPYINPDFGRDT